MAEAIFTYKEIKTTLQCNLNDKMKDIIDNFLNPIKEKGDSFLYLYNGKEINKDLSFNEQATGPDKEQKKINIIVTKKDAGMISKDIICPECKENIILDINKFNINLKGCKNNHEINNVLLLNEYEERQKIDTSKIICDICKTHDKNQTNNNEFYICNTCNKNMCPSCNPEHDKNHAVINYEDKNYICKKHNDAFIKYCEACKEDICISCESEHANHNIFDFTKILINKDELLKSSEALKDIIDKFKYKIDIIKETISKMLTILDTYYNLNNNIINNYNIKKRNFHYLQNLQNIKNNNDKIINDIKNIINSNQIFEINKYPFYNLYTNDSSEMYIGDGNNNQREGKGTIYYDKDDKDRKKYEGDFKNNLRDGKGKLYMNNGDTYEGDWKNDKKEGKGIFYFGRESNKGDRYEGDWKNDKREGKGIYYFHNGNRYEGDWKNHFREGKGIFYWSDGDRYEGDWKNDEREGKGTMYYKNGKVKNGTWKKDKQV